MPLGLGFSCERLARCKTTLLRWMMREGDYSPERECRDSSADATNITAKPAGRDGQGLYRSAWHWIWQNSLLFGVITQLTLLQPRQDDELCKNTRLILRSTCGGETVRLGQKDESRDEEKIKASKGMKGC